MPIHDYRCPQGHAFDHIVHHGESPEARLQCPECAKEGDFALADKVPSVWGNYKIHGNNSASHTPKRWKGF